MKTILTVLGTRPEAIKLAPVILEFRENKYFKNHVCITGQHVDFVKPYLEDFDIKIDCELSKNPISAPSLHQSCAHIISNLEPILKQIKPDLVVVQGDTTTAFCAALAAFYLQIPIAHIEAGLRTDNIHAPWPEEAHRCFIDKISTYYFAPTQTAKEHLIAEGVLENNIWVVGNTAIDAIRLAQANPPETNLINEKPYIVVTAHRRENQGKQLVNICNALKKIAANFPNINILFFLHPNPKVKDHVLKMLQGISNIKLVEHLNHRDFIHVLDKSMFILTDSGGIQEEVPFMGKPVLILRDSTERPEGIMAGTAMLVGTYIDKIVQSCAQLIQNPIILRQMSKKHYPHGDGFAAKQIVTILQEELTNMKI